MVSLDAADNASALGWVVAAGTVRFYEAAPEPIGRTCGVPWQ
jgi:hypothetical protein